MNESINFLRNRRTVVKKNKAENILRLTAICTLLLIACMSVGMFILRSQSRLATLEAEERQLQRNLTAIQEKTAKYVLVKDRLRSLSSTIEKRSHMDDSVEKILDDIPSGIQITSMTIEKKTLILNISSSSLSLMDRYISQFSTIDSKESLYKYVVLDNLSFDGKNSFTAQLEAELL